MNQDVDTPDVDGIEKLILFKFDPVMYASQSAEYRTDYSKKIIYYVMEVVSANPNITINQACSLLRNTLQIPEELTRSTVCSILGSEYCKIFSVYESAKDIKHLKLAKGYLTVQKQISEQYPELLQYEAPLYNKKKREENNGAVATP